MLEEENSVQSVTFAYIIIQGNIDLKNVEARNNVWIFKNIPMKKNPLIDEADKQLKKQERELKSKNTEYVSLSKAAVTANDSLSQRCRAYLINSNYIIRRSIFFRQRWILRTKIFFSKL